MRTPQNHLLFLLLSLSSAKTIITAPGPGYDSTVTLDGSILSANPTATTIVLGCLPSEPDCGLFPRETIIYGPSTYKMDMSDPSSDFTATADCAFASATAVCRESAGGSEANFPGSSTETYTEIGTWLINVVEGGEKLTAGAGAAVSTTPVSASASLTAIKSGSGAATSAASATASAAAGSQSRVATLSTAAQSASGSGSAPAQASTGAGSGNVAMIGGGFLGVAAGVFGGLLL